MFFFLFQGKAVSKKKNTTVSSATPDINIVPFSYVCLWLFKYHFKLLINRTSVGKEDGAPLSHYPTLFSLLAG